MKVISTEVPGIRSFLSTIILDCQQLILSHTHLGQSFLILTCHCVTFTVSKYLQLDGQAAASFSAFAGFFLNCFPLNCIPCFLSGGDEKQTFTTAGYSHLSSSRRGGNKLEQGAKQCGTETTSLVQVQYRNPNWPMLSAIIVTNTETTFQMENLVKVEKF